MDIAKAEEDGQSGGFRIRKSLPRKKRNLQRRRGSGTTFLHRAEMKGADGLLNRDAGEFVLGCPWPPDSWKRTENYGTTRFGGSAAFRRAILGGSAGSEILRSQRVSLGPRVSTQRTENLGDGCDTRRCILLSLRVFCPSNHPKRERNHG